LLAYENVFYITLGVAIGRFHTAPNLKLHMPAIHLIEKAGTAQGLKPINFTAGLWSSGYWKVSEETATKLVGGSIFLHTAWSAPSHFGGAITSFSVHNAPGTDVHGRIVFAFTALPTGKGVKAPAGAAGEKRIAW
jgi:hypothetical protein